MHRVSHPGVDVNGDGKDHGVEDGGNAGRHRLDDGQQRKEFAALVVVDDLGEARSYADEGERRQAAKDEGEVEAGLVLPGAAQGALRQQRHNADNGQAHVAQLEAAHKEGQHKAHQQQRAHCGRGGDGRVELGRPAVQLLHVRPENEGGVHVGKHNESRHRKEQPNLPSAPVLTLPRQRHKELPNVVHLKEAAKLLANLGGVVLLVVVGQRMVSCGGHQVGFHRGAAAIGVIAGELRRRVNDDAARRGRGRDWSIVIN
ncbi:hypothetical protein TYRP_017919 [Tyrophagus putrescentiae]|nr:hypothetical protein TYRP_017919 [Tyrophagus putrescentiae]